MRYVAFRLENQRIYNHEVVNGIWAMGQRKDTLNWDYLPLTFKGKQQAISFMKNWLKENRYPDSTPLYNTNGNGIKW